MKLLRFGWVALLIALVSMAGLASPARADGSAPVRSFTADVALGADGTAHVSTTIVMGFDEVSGRGPIIAIPTRQADGANPDEWYEFPISHLAVSSPSGANTQVEQSDDSGVLSLRIGNENIVYNREQTYLITYDVKGLIISDHPQSHLDEFSWNPLNAPDSRIEDVTVTVTGPATITQAACFHGTKLTDSCPASVSGATATYTVGSLPSGEKVQVVAGFPVGTFGGVQPIKSHRTTLVNAFSLTPASGALAGVLGLGAVACLIGIARRYTRDDVYLGLTPGLAPAVGQETLIGKASRKVPVAVAFRPPKNATPGEIGTLTDATADTIDISATLVDLAVRGHLVIANADERGRDQVLTRQHSTNDRLQPFERLLLTRIFKRDDIQRVSALKSSEYGGLQNEMKAALYDRMMQRKWFRSNPQFAQAAPMALGVLILIGSAFLAIVLASRGLSLAAIPVAILGLGLIVMSSKFRTRTAAGSAVLAEARGFELYLRTAEAATIKFEEGENIFSRYLPYAMIFGVADRWAKVFAELGAAGRYREDISWYYGANMYDYYFLSASLNNLNHGFSSAMSQARAAEMAERAQAASSTSSGGSGFSGGGASAAAG